MRKCSIPAIALLTLVTSCQQTPTPAGPNAEQKALKKVYDDATAVQDNIIAEAKAQLEAVQEEVARKGPTPETTEQITRLERAIRNSELLNEKARREFEAEYRKLESAGR